MRHDCGPAAMAGANWFRRYRMLLPIISFRCVWGMETAPMKVFSVAFALFVGIGAAMAANAQGDRTVSNEPGVVAFLNVNVVPMDREQILEHQTVVVRDGR